MKLSIRLIKTFFVLFMSTLLGTGCNNSGSSNTHSENEIKSDTTEKINISDSQINSIKDSITCLDIAFIENLESSWESSYKEPDLAKKGFSRGSSKKIENGKIIVFQNVLLKNKLEISKIKYPDGESLFKVEYTVVQNQFDCFKDFLIGTRYHTSGNDETFKKEGLGTYKEKYISINKSNSTIVYSHRVGKELQAAPIENL